jgi:hypothetical protein
MKNNLPSIKRQGAGENALFEILLKSKDYINELIINFYSCIKNYLRI